MIHFSLANLIVLSQTQSPALRQGHEPLYRILSLVS